MYSNLKFYEKENELVRLGGLKEVNTPGEKINTFDFNEIKNILLMFTGSLNFYVGVYTNLIIGN